MKRKRSRISVRCSPGIAQEMARYDHATIIEKTLISHKDEWVESYCKRLGFEDVDHEKEQHRIYDFIIENEYHTIGRWLSFGIVPKTL